MHAVPPITMVMSRKVVPHSWIAIWINLSASLQTTGSGLNSGSTIGLRDFAPRSSGRTEQRVQDEQITLALFRTPSHAFQDRNGCDLSLPRVAS